MKLSPQFLVWLSVLKVTRKWIESMVSLWNNEPIQTVFLFFISKVILRKVRCFCKAFMVHFDQPIFPLQYYNKIILIYNQILDKNKSFSRLYLSVCLIYAFLACIPVFMPFSVNQPVSIQKWHHDLVAITNYNLSNTQERWFVWLVRF